jgi:adenine-specific DNA-methyltransferase
MTSKILNDLIQDVNHDTLTRFFQDRSSLFRADKASLKEYETDQFKEGTKLGELPFGLIDHIIVCCFKVTRELSERSGKKAQYELAKKIIRDLGMDAGIFVFIGENGAFRFSLVYASYLGTKVDYSNFRRFTYYVSPQLTNKTFRQRIGEGDFSSLESIKEAFSVEKVTKEFYQKISYWYFWACQQCQFPKDAEAEENGRQVAVIRLITRMIFIWFMREMKLVPNNLFEKSFFKAALKNHDDANSTYYMAILQNLFFATLNTKPEERNFRSPVRGAKGINPDFGNQYKYRYQDLFHAPDQLTNYFGEIPFLNGGLFDCLDDKPQGRYVDGFTETKKFQPRVPNVLFFSPERTVDINAELGTTNRTYRVEGLINILSTYNFTIDENTLDDQDVALDPELLGKVFENLLASFNPETSTTARKATGSYYTPREIVDYMVEESLKAYFANYLDDVDAIEDKLESLFDTNNDENPFTAEETRRMVDLVEDVRIVDPAVGSGAFPMGALNKLVFILAKLDKDNVLWKKAQLDGADAISDPAVRANVKESIQNYFREKDANYGRKLYLIQKCIYGVDIQQIAVEIAKLRFFIALLVDEKVDKSKENWGIEPLPNLDFKIMQGNSLISEYLGIRFTLSANSADQSGNLQLFADENKDLIEAFDQKKTAYQIAFDPQLKKALQKEIEELLLQIFEDLVKRQKSIYYQRLKAIEQKYASIPDKNDRQTVIDDEKKLLNRSFGFDIDQAENDLRKFTSRQRIKPFFPWEMYFSEVFLEKNGFDIVIGNPPYIQLQRNSGELANLYEDKGFETFNRMGDIYCLFYELGYELLRQGGHLCFITSNKWMRAGYGENLRNFLAKKTNPLLLIDFAGTTVFENVTVDNNILLFSKAPNKEQCRSVTIRDDFSELAHLKEYIVNNSKFNTFSKKDKIWIISTPFEEQIFQKINLRCVPLIEWDLQFYYGIKTGYNEAFIINESIRDSLIKEDPNSEEIIKPVLRGRDIKKYTAEFAKIYLLVVHNGYVNHFGDKVPPININRYPSVKKWLDKYWKEISNRKDHGNTPYNLRNCAYQQEFLNEILVWKAVGRNLSFALWGKDKYLIAPASFISSKYNKYLLAYLQSNIAKHYILKYSDTTGAGDIMLNIRSLGIIPAPKISILEQESIVILLDRLLEIIDSRNSIKTLDKDKLVLAIKKEIDYKFYEILDLSSKEIHFLENINHYQ